MSIKTAITDTEIACCWEAVFLLRPMLKQGEFVSQIKAVQKEGYKLLYIEEKGKVVSLAGYRIFTMLYAGKMLYIDDLSTLDPHRGKGYASLLLNHLCYCKTRKLQIGAFRQWARENDSSQTIFQREFYHPCFSFQQTNRLEIFEYRGQWQNKKIVEPVVLFRF
jgi:GNAT superfamily N-acetyltransferase